LLQGQAYIKRLPPTGTGVLRQLASGTGVLKGTHGYRDGRTYSDYWLQCQAYRNRHLGRVTGVLRQLATGTSVLKETHSYRDRPT